MLNELILSGLGVCLRYLRETIAVVVLAVGGRSQIIRSDTYAAVMTPNGLGIYGGCGFHFRSLHSSDLLVRGTFHGMRNILRRVMARSGPNAIVASKHTWDP